MTKPAAPRAARPYHHGNLATALVQEALAMAAQGGPESVVLREVARRVGVSPTAAYRHFSGQADLAEAVRLAALGRLTEHMHRYLAAAGPLPGPAGQVPGSAGPLPGLAGQVPGPAGQVPGLAGQASGSVGQLPGLAGQVPSPEALVPLPGIAPGSPQERAIRRLEATGRAYFDFAITEPGLFRCFCVGLPLPDEVLLPMPGAHRPTLVPPDRAPFGILDEVLDDLVTAGVLTPARRAAGVDIALWSAVHGLSVLCLDGPLSELPRSAQYAMLTAVTDVIFHGLAGPDTPA